MGFNALIADLTRDGYHVVRGVFTPEQVSAMLCDFTARVAGTPDASIRGIEGTVYAARNVLDLWPQAREVSRQPPLAEILSRVLGSGYGLVRGLFFDKPPGNSWALPWHKDLTIAVQRHAPCTAFTKPTRKGGVPHLEAPESVLERMLTLRLHLDAVDDENGPLKVIAGSHRTGKTLDLTGAIATIHAQAGDVLLMRPLLAHCSNRSRDDTQRHRRILHLEFAADAVLPEGLRWHAFL